MANLIQIGVNVTIDGNAQNRVTISGNNASQIFRINQGVTATILPGNMLGGTDGKAIGIDQDAAGQGWFIDMAMCWASITGRG